jgi:hypothetical protein
MYMALGFGLSAFSQTPRAGTDSRPPFARRAHTSREIEAGISLVRSSDIWQS